MALDGVPEFEVLVGKLTRSFAINGKSPSTLKNYLRCLSYLTMHFKTSPELLSKDQVMIICFTANRFIKLH
jgi:hypothetical protein